MNPQDLFGRRVAKKLDQGLDQLPQHIQARLAIARDLALQHAPRPKTHTLGGGTLGQSWAAARQKFTLAALATLAAATMMAAQYTRIQDTAYDTADIDEIILSDDAPMQSYTDPGFGAALRGGLLGGARD